MMQQLTTEATRRTLSRTEARGIVADVVSGAGNTQLVQKNRDRRILRWRGEDGHTVIAKVLLRPQLRHRVRRFFRLDAPSYECRGMRRLDRAGVRVPRPFGRYRAPPNTHGITDVLLMEDMGACTPVMHYLQRLVSEGDEEGVSATEKAVVAMTAGILSAGVVDTDHSLRNIVVCETGELIRLDLEIARWVVWPRRLPGMYGRMLGRMLGSHTFTMQPETHRTRAFAAALAQRLQPPARALASAQARLDEMLAGQARGGGPDVKLPDVWTAPTSSGGS